MIENDPSAVTRSTTIEFGYIHPLQAGKVLGIVYAFLGLVFLPFLILPTLVAAQQNAGAAAGMIGMAVFMMLIYPAIGFIGGVISAAFYNLAAKWVGGIRVDVK